MSSYFDALQREVSEAAEQCGENDAAFLDAVQGIEGRMWADVTAITGDREFPDDLREAILGAFAVKSVHQVGDLPMPEKARERVLAYRSSRVVEDIHDLFHDLARRRLQTRFGLLSDNPPGILARRDEHDAEVPGWEKVEAADAWVPADSCERCGDDVTEGRVWVREDETGATMGHAACSKDCAEWVEETLDPEV